MAVRKSAYVICHYFGDDEKSIVVVRSGKDLHMMSPKILAKELGISDFNQEDDFIEAVEVKYMVDTETGQKIGL